MIKEITLKIKKLKGEEIMEDNNNRICGFYNATVDDSNNAIKNGSGLFEQAQRITKVGGCGKCVANNKALFDELILTNKLSDNSTVCGCLQVTVQDIDEAIKNGAKSFEEVQEITQVGTGCGQCVESNRELVNQLLARQKL